MPEVPEIKECPMCGGDMRVDSREGRDHLPRMAQPELRLVREWVCPECDYFEEVLEEG
jgi:rubredoxin